MTVGDDTYFFVKNLQGDVTKIIDENGTTVATYAYDAWGKILSENEDSSIAGLNPFRYRGYVYDPETELYYLQSRYYDPLTGRFLNADDTAFIGATDSPLGINAFSYCENNSIMNIDPSGYVVVADDVICIGAAIIISALISYMCTPQFQQSWNSVCNAVGNGLSNIWSGLVKKIKTAWVTATIFYKISKIVTKWAKSKVKKLIKAFKIYLSAQKASARIPNYLKTKDGKVNLKKFNKPGKKNKKGGRERKGPKDWRISRDKDGHKGSKWKLLKKMETELLL